MNSGIDSVLIVEDSDEDFEITVASLRLANVRNPIVRCRNGREVSQFLQQQPPFDRVPAPKLILLDLNIAGTDGRKLIARFRQEKRLTAVPISILSTSSNPADIESCYASSANAYLIKPVDLVKFEAMIANFITFWFDTATLPGGWGHAKNATFFD